MEDYAESSTAVVLSRCDDPMSRALRSEGTIELEELVDLQRNASPIHQVASSVGTIPTAVFSSHKPSTHTKPTSNGSTYPVDRHKGKGKAAATYTSSLSATQGSGSEADAEQEHALVGIGDWAGDGVMSDRPLKGKYRKRQRASKRLRSKKPVVVIQQRTPDGATTRENESSTATQFACGSKETRYFRRRSVRQDQDGFVLAEEGRASQLTEDRKPTMPLSRIRFYFLIGLLVAITLTLALSTFAARYAAAHYSGKSRVACTKGIVFAATVFTSFFSVLAMLVARRALHEALLAGLLQCVVGFVLVVEIHEFIM